MYLRDHLKLNHFSTQANSTVKVTFESKYLQLKFFIKIDHYIYSLPVRQAVMTLRLCAMTHQATCYAVCCMKRTGDLYHECMCTCSLFISLSDVPTVSTGVRREAHYTELPHSLSSPEELWLQTCSDFIVLMTFQIGLNLYVCSDFNFARKTNKKKTTILHFAIVIVTFSLRFGWHCLNYQKFHWLRRLRCMFDVRFTRSWPIYIWVTFYSGDVVDLNETSVLRRHVCAHQHVWECVVVAIKRKRGPY